MNLFREVFEDPDMVFTSVDVLKQCTAVSESFASSAHAKKDVS